MVTAPMARSRTVVVFFMSWSPITWFYDSPIVVFAASREGVERPSAVMAISNLPTAA
jgi:hypothetical protein